MEAKRLLRSRLASARAARTASERAAAGEAIARHGHAAWSRVVAVAAYAGIADEPPTRPLLDALRASGVRVLLPVVTADSLDWADYLSWDRLARVRHGLLEPAGPRLGAAVLHEVSVIVVPALAVDRAGHRLGRGLGYYDRALASTRRAVAVTFDDEVLDDIPAEPHDVPVAAVLRPAGLLDLPAPGG